ncbi:unnamed protein product [Nesidiocoris tenuis]|uniref:tRNA (uracil(54)-C(5))-methyltransferase n=1 Tax=Nesidiocoris tenuis TaxID=355587 RepID=A0A6H5H3Q1_9HEMI|nr:unnamed protein product [Nesidiocoris tenuis]
MEENQPNPKPGVQDGEPEKVEAGLDEYAYKDVLFTSEVFKVELKNLPKYYGMAQLRKFLTKKMELNITKVKAPSVKSRGFAFVCFPSAEERDKALKVLDGAKFKNSTLGVKLSQKMDEAKTWISKLGFALVKANPALEEWAEKQKALNGGLVCKLHEIKSLPEFCESYRNKCEFTIGTNNLTQKRTVGFRLGSYASGTIEVAPIENVKIVPEVTAKAVKVFEKFVQASEYDVFSPATLKGHWKQLTVRVGTLTGQLMLIVGFHPQNLTDEEIKKVKEDVKTFFTEGDGNQLTVDSLYFEIMKRKDRGQTSQPAELLLGKESIQESMCGLKFNISPQSFFQINTRCAELLVSTVKELADINEETVVFDICCGIGTFGLCLAKDCKKVMGVEIVDKAVQDARTNASQNGITNCEFFSGKAEDIITSVVKRVSNDRIVGIVDPPRAGLHKNAVLMLRKIENLNNFVYLSCDFKAAFNNFTDLGRPPSKTMSGAPFVPVAAVPVDVFPQTNHYEFILYFERLNANDDNTDSSTIVKNDVESAEIVSPSVEYS